VTPVKPILLACLGNGRCGDDAAALHVAGMIRDRLPEGVELAELDDRAGAMLSELSGRQALIVVDAVRLPEGPSQPPGEIIDVDYLDPARPRLETTSVVSSHGWSVASELELAKRLDLLPAFVRLVGVVVSDIAPHHGLSKAVRAKLPLLVERVEQRLHEACVSSTALECP
jgi:hydrogenase maturation protease